ncbi:transglutaminase family protein [Kiritimatiellaeota bacterium B1221]|nr:transglutaminase family protein [Kiritimatiellaeota bacterium B1221]
MWLKTSCDLMFDIQVPTPFILMLRPRSGAAHWIAREEYKIIPGVPAFEFTDPHGNLCQRLIAPIGIFGVYTSAEVKTRDFMEQAPGAPYVEVGSLPDNVLNYLLPSRYCESERFGQLATEITSSTLPGYDQVKAIENWVRNNIQFEPCGSDSFLSAGEINERGWGVCRDFAHLGIALCRSLSIPARMVVGYLYGLQPMALHAWFEAYVAGHWYAFDATQPQPAGGYVAIGYGRDAADVAVYNQFGPPATVLSQNISVQLMEK